MPNLNPPDRPADFCREDFDRELLAIATDPKVRSLAGQRVGDRDLAEDVVNEAFYIVSRRPDPEHIADLRAYFCTVVIHEAFRLRSMPGTLLFGDPETALSTCHRMAPATPNLEEQAVTDLMAQARLARFAARKHEWRSSVPRRSADPDRYRDLIVAKAEAILLGTAALEEASVKALETAYPEWFNEPGCASNSRDQRLSRARGDIWALLRKVVTREELTP